MTDTSATFAKAGSDAKGSAFDRAIRKIFPSTSLLTFNPLFRTIINAFDIVPRLIYPEFRDLPPNHLRVRIGVGNRILNNQVHFLMHARDFWMFVFTEGLADAGSTILDIGSGCGRWAHWLRDYNFRGRRFTGTYVGIDIDGEAIAWCEKHYDAERFRFHHSTHASVSYHQAGEKTAHYRVPEPDGTFDLVVSNSLLTHVLEAELENYIQGKLPAAEARRRDHALAFQSRLSARDLWDPPHVPAHDRQCARRIDGTAGSGRRLSHRLPVQGRRAAGFKDCEIVHMPGGAQHQPILLCKK